MFISTHHRHFGQKLKDIIVVTSASPRRSRNFVPDITMAEMTDLVSSLIKLEMAAEDKKKAEEISPPSADKTKESEETSPPAAEEKKEHLSKTFTPSPLCRTSVSKILLFRGFKTTKNVTC